MPFGESLGDLPPLALGAVAQELSEEEPDAGAGEERAGGGGEDWYGVGTEHAGLRNSRREDRFLFTRRGHEAGLARDQPGLQPVGHTKLAEDIGQVVADGLLRYPKMTSYLSVRLR